MYNLRTVIKPTFLPENSTAFERDYNYRGRHEVDGHIIRSVGTQINIEEKNIAGFRD